MAPLFFIKARGILIVARKSPSHIEFPLQSAPRSDKSRRKPLSD
jgi:hypothetical protein